MSLEYQGNLPIRPPMWAMSPAERLRTENHYRAQLAEAERADRRRLDDIGRMELRITLDQAFDRKHRCAGR